MDGERDFIVRPPNSQEREGFGALVQKRARARSRTDVDGEEVNCRLGRNVWRDSTNIVNEEETSSMKDKQRSWLDSMPW